MYSKCSILIAHNLKGRCLLLEEVDPVAHILSLMERLKDSKGLVLYPAPIGANYSDAEKQGWTHAHYARLEVAWRSQHGDTEPLVTYICVQLVKQEVNCAPLVIAAHQTVAQEAALQGCLRGTRQGQTLPFAGRPQAVAAKVQAAPQRPGLLPHAGLPGPVAGMQGKNEKETRSRGKKR